MIELPAPYVLYLGDPSASAYAKTAIGLKDWAPEKCLSEYACGESSFTIGLPRLSLPDAAAQGARSMVIGVATIGGAIPDEWMPDLVAALEAGLDLVSGMHNRLSDILVLRDTASRLGRTLFDVRVPPANIPIGTGRKRSGKRLLTVGTDCALGKKYTALALAQAFRARGRDADFRATGQTGIMIAGGGVPMDAVISDFEAGAAEMLSPDAPDAHWDVIEGQGSLFHPAYAGVSLGLLHGSQPDVIVLCHAAGRTHVAGYPDFETPAIEEAIALHLKLGSRTNPAIRCAGIALNTVSLSPEEAQRLLDAESARLNLPVADPIRGGASFDRLVDACLG
jgi:uncharacterized NAD-dependent epimerase/dehydratase family protein